MEQTSSRGTTKYYVNNITGSDTTGTGSITSPFKTVNYALTRLADGDILYVIRGVYIESSIDYSGHVLTTGITLKSLGKVTFKDTAFTFLNGSGITIDGFTFNGLYLYIMVSSFINFNFKNNLTLNYGGQAVTLKRDCGYCTVENNVFGYAAWAGCGAGSNDIIDGIEQPSPPVHHLIYRDNINYFDGHNGLNAGNSIENCTFENNIHFGSQFSYAYFCANNGPNRYHLFRNNIAFGARRWDDNYNPGTGYVYGSVTDSVVEDNFAFNCGGGFLDQSNGNDEGTIMLPGCAWQCKGSSKRNIFRRNYAWLNDQSQMDFYGSENCIAESNMIQDYAGPKSAWGSSHGFFDYPYKKQTFGCYLKNYPVGKYSIAGRALTGFSFKDFNGRLIKFYKKGNGDIYPTVDSTGIVNISESWCFGSLTIYNVRVIPNNIISANVTTNHPDYLSNPFNIQFILTPSVSTNITIFIDKLTPNNTYTIIRNGIIYLTAVANLDGEISFKDTITAATAYVVSGVNTHKPIAGNIIAKDLKYYEPDSNATIFTLKRKWLFISKDDNGFGNIQDLTHQWTILNSNNVDVTAQALNHVFRYFKYDNRSYQTSNNETTQSTPGIIVDFPSDGVYIVKHRITNTLSQSDEKSINIDIISEFAEIEGYIRNTSNDPIEDAQIIITSPNGTYTEISHATGYYCLQDIPMNRVYQIQVIKAGYNIYSGNTPLIDAKIKQIKDILMQPIYS